MILASCGGGGGGTSGTNSLTSTTYSLTGSVTGLPSGTSLTLSDGLATATINTNSSFSLSGIPQNASYSVTVVNQPSGAICTVNNGTGAGINGNVTDISVVCSAKTFTVGGSLKGLEAGESLIISNSTGENFSLLANGAFTFSTPIAYNGSYAVTISTQPTGETCTVTNGTGSGMVANVGNVGVTCATNTYSVSGSVSGLSSGQQVTILDNNADPITATANGAFTFSTPIAYNGSYAVTVGTQPTGETCTVTNGTGSSVTASVSNVSVACSYNTYAVSGTVSGLAAGAQLTLQNNNSDSLTINSNGAFTFTTPIAYESNYNVTVATQPVGQTCSVSGGSGNVTAAVTGVSVTCLNNITANAGSSVTTFVPGPAVTLDASGSSSLSGSPLTYLWQISSAPAGSTATLSSTTAVKPSFVPDVIGTYTFSLTVSDGTSSATSQVTVTAASIASQFAVAQSSAVSVINGTYQPGSKFLCSITNTSSYSFSVTQFIFESISSTGSPTTINTVTSSSQLNGGVIGPNQSITITETLSAPVSASSWKGIFTVGYPSAPSTGTVSCAW